MLRYTPSMTGRQLTSRFRAIPVLIYLVLGLLILGPIVLHPFHMFLGGTGDPQQFMWYLGWFWYAVGHGLNPFQSHLINAPVGQNLMWNTSILAESFLFGPLTWVFNATFTYNLLWLLNFVLSCVFGEKIAKRLGVRRSFAVVGGVLTGIMPYTTAQSLFHIHLWTTSVILAMVYLVLAGIQSGIRRPIGFGLVLGLLAAFEFYTSIEVFATLALTTVIVLLFALIVAPRKIVGGVQWPLVVAVLVAGLEVLIFAAPGIYEMFRGSNRPSGALLAGGVYVNDLLNFVLPTLVYLVHSPQTNLISAHYTGNFWENNGYLGVPVIFLFLFAAVRLWKKPAARVAVYASLAIIFLSMGPFLHINGHQTSLRMPWLILQRVPLIESALPSRLMLYADILVVMLLVVSAEHLFRTTERGCGIRKVMSVMMALVVLTWLPRIPYPHSVTPDAANALRPSSPVYAQVVGQVTYLLTPSPADPMQAIAEAGYPFAMVNAYGYPSNTWPRAHGLVLMANILKPGRSQQQVESSLVHGLPELHASRVMYFPLRSTDKLSQAAYQALTNVLGAPLAEDDGAVVWDIPQQYEGGRFH
jgi:hypothetical protein